MSPTPPLPYSNLNLPRLSKLQYRDHSESTRTGIGHCVYVTSISLVFLRYKLEYLTA